MTCKAGQMSVHVVSAVNIVKTRDQSASSVKVGVHILTVWEKVLVSGSLNFGRTDPPRAGCLLLFLFFPFEQKLNYILHLRFRFLWENDFFLFFVFLFLTPKHKNVLLVRM